MPISFRYERAKPGKSGDLDREAFKTEYMWMYDYGFRGPNERGQLYNRIWSPGRSYYYSDEKRLYLDDKW